MSDRPISSEPSAVQGKPSVWQIFREFLSLGCTSFGGPAAHLGFFHTRLVARKGWLDDATFSETVALCHFLPGPSSSQVGMAIGAHLQGQRGALAAWLGFTLPSALIMLAVALGLGWFNQAWLEKVLSGVKIAVMIIIFEAVLVMGRKFCSDAPRLTITALVAGALVMLPGVATQSLLIALSAAVGIAVLRSKVLPVASSLTATPQITNANRSAIMMLLIFGLGLGLAFSDDQFTTLYQHLAAAAYSAGALVFGGGHVVLPLLQESIVASGWLDGPTFFAGYGAAQLLPGPLFSFAAFVGAAAAPVSPVAGALTMLIAIFLPGYLLLLGVLPFWSRLRQLRWVSAALLGVNAAVVGLLVATLITMLLGSISVGEFARWQFWLLLGLGGASYWCGWLPAWALVLVLGAGAWLVSLL